MTDTRSRDWCFTLNNYTEEEYDVIHSLSLSQYKYIVVGKEVGESGTNHLQGYIYFVNAKSMSAVKKMISKRCHLESAKGSPLQAATYCKKDNNDYYENGELPVIQGKRTDLDEIRDILKQTNKMSDVVMVAKSYQSVKMAEQILKYHEKPRMEKPYVEWYYGPTGTGKSKKAYEVLSDECYTCLSTGKWFDGYDAHKNVLIDDMRKDFMKFHELLRLLDRYAMRVECKGGTRQFVASHIIITSCYHPKDMFETREDIQQLLRRIDKIENFE
ncbi:replication associated protein [Lake Sarah-associated circular virus-10]|uniref:Replication-associated protein n=1 Tax=Lake Sarah-associated circular virus-10 TaxID=1685736 RepID=A0A140AQK3_9VIRU|nr:replication associated protein [Lake Sarah-associated circular virus-10]ALE29606.1 replication associated protein [Lake Sarah-associated circular virus-10]